MSVIIEFVGAGGAGKSHVCRELLKKKLNPDIHDAVIANHHKVSAKDIFAYSVLNITTLFAVFSFLRKMKSVTFRHKTAHFIEIIIYLIRRDYLFPNRKMILFDHGIMQILRVLERKSEGAVAVHNLDKNHQKLFFNEIDKLVIVDVDSEKIINRRISRDKIRFPSKGSMMAEMNSISDSMIKTQKDAEFVKKEWGVKVLTYINNSDVGLGSVYDFINS